MKASKGLGRMSTGRPAALLDLTMKPGLGRMGSRLIRERATFSATHRGGGTRAHTAGRTRRGMRFEAVQCTRGW